MKQIIWSSDALLDETAREYYQNFKREELDDDAEDEIPGYFRGKGL